MVTRTTRTKSAHTRRRTLEDELAMGRVTVEGMDPNYYYHVVNDKHGRVEKLKQRGYEIVEHDGVVSMGEANAKEAGSAVSTTVDSKDGTKGVLMRIPREYKDEDDAFRQAQVDRSEEALYRQAEKEEGRYGKIETHDTRAK